MAPMFVFQMKGLLNGPIFTLKNYVVLAPAQNSHLIPSSECEIHTGVHLEI